MNALVADQVIVELQAKVDRYNNNVADAERRFNGSMRGIESSALRAERRISSSLSGIAKNFGAGLLGGIAAGLSVDGLKTLLDSATGVTNALKVAGLAGEDLEKVYRKLYESAQRNAAPLSAMAQLYSRVAGAQKELGVSSEQVLSLTDNVAKSLRVSGGSAQQASGALLQLAQALSGGKVQAEEYNSLLDGMRPLLQAAANGIEQAGGSVAKLTALVKDGEISSKALFDGINAGASTMDAQLGNATMTVSQGFVQIQNSLIDAAKKFDETTETSKALGSALGDVATAISNFNVDHAVSELQRFIKSANDALFAAQNFARSLGETLGVDGLGKALTNSPLGIYLGSGGINQDRISGDAATPPAYLQEWARRNYGSAMSTPTTGRLPAAPKVTPIDITRPEYAVKGAESAAKETERAAKVAQRLAEQATKRLNASIASQTAVAVDAAAALLGQHEGKNRGNINAFLKAGGVDLDAATTAWCAAFVNSALAQVGVTGSGSNVATDFLNWGTKVDASQIQRGDVLVDPNGRSAGQTGGHVGLATGQARFQEGVLQVQMLSGNASNKVEEDWVNASDVVARRATEAVQLHADALDHITDASNQKLIEQEQTLKRQEQAYEELGAAIGNALNGLVNAFADGKLEAEELLGIVVQLAQQLLSMNGLGGGGGFLSGLLGGLIPGFANGTRSAPGGLAWVGERGPELVNLPRGSQVIPNHKLGGGSQSIVINAPINAPGADAAALARVERSVQELGRNIPKMVDQRTDTRQTRKTRA